jgi:hypothetical protein
LAIGAHCKASTVVAPPRTLGPHWGLPEHPGVEEAVQLTDNELFDPYEQALLWTESDVGIVVTPDEQMHLLAITPNVMPVESRDDASGSPQRPSTNDGP